MQKTLTAIQALDELRQFRKLDQSIVTEKIDLRQLIDENDNVKLTLTFTNCYFKDISLTFIEFSKLITFQNCIIDNLNVYATYFLGGFIIANNTFNEIVPFMHANHGQNGVPMILSGNTFNEFVDFEDANFTSQLEFTDNKFKKGTNLLGKMQLAASFPDNSIILNNVGEMTIATPFGTR